jgi:hypothetical protein
MRFYPMDMHCQLNLRVAHAMGLAFILVGMAAFTAFAQDTAPYDIHPDMFLLPVASPPPLAVRAYFPQITNALAPSGYRMYAKFNINSITNVPKTGDTYNQAHLADWVKKVQAILADAGLERPDDVAWNLANQLDADYYPQCSDGQAYIHTDGGEAMPLINEISIKSGKFNVELWFPFVTANDAALWAAGTYTVDIAVKQSPAYAPVTTSFAIDPMAYATSNEFRVFIYNTGITQSNDPAINVTVKLNGQPIDNAMDRNTFVHGIWKIVPNGYGYQVDDPRSNGRIDAWQTHSDGSAAILPETLGKKNTCTDTDSFPRQGLPIFVKNGPMQTVGEIGYIYRSNLEDERPAEKNKWYWNTINLMHKNEGAKLLDRFTVNPTSSDVNTFVKPEGLISITMPDTNTMASLFTGMQIGFSPQNIYTLTDQDAHNLGNALTSRRMAKFPQGFKQFQDLVDAPPNSDPSQNYGELKPPIDAIAAKWCTNGVPGFDLPNDKVREDVFRNITTMVVFQVSIPIDDALTMWIRKFPRLTTADLDNDSDGDGLTGRQEFFAGTDPQSPLSKLSFISGSWGDSSNLLTWCGTTNNGPTAPFKLYRATHLANSNDWAYIRDIPRNATGTNRVWDTVDPTNETLFYQIRVPETYN